MCNLPRQTLNASATHSKEIEIVHCNTVLVANEECTVTPGNCGDVRGAPSYFLQSLGAAVEEVLSLGPCSACRKTVEFSENDTERFVCEEMYKLRILARFPHCRRALSRAPEPKNRVSGSRWSRSLWRVWKF